MSVKPGSDGPIWGADFSINDGNDADSCLLGVWKRVSNEWRRGNFAEVSSIRERIEHTVDLAYEQYVGNCQIARCLPLTAEGVTEIRISPLDLSEITFRAGGTLILDRVSWQVVAGEHWAILGPNGAGKTTLLRIACGYLWPNGGGEVRRLGQRMLDLRDLRRSIGWISASLVEQIPHDEAAIDTVVSGRLGQVGLTRFHGIEPAGSDYRQAEDYMEQLACGHLRSQAFGTLSQGEQQLVLIARARMARPLLIVLDEPCAGLDPGMRERFLATLQTLLSESGAISIVLVTHHIEEIVPGIDHALILKDGRVLCQGAPRDIVTSDTIQELYGVSVRRIEHEAGRLWPIWG